MEKTHNLDSLSMRFKLILNSTMSSKLLSECCGCSRSSTLLFLILNQQLRFDIDVNYMQIYNSTKHICDDQIMFISQVNKWDILMKYFDDDVQRVIRYINAIIDEHINKSVLNNIRVFDYGRLTFSTYYVVFKSCNSITGDDVIHNSVSLGYGKFAEYNISTKQFSTSYDDIKYVEGDYILIHNIYHNDFKFCKMGIREFYQLNDSDIRISKYNLTESLFERFNKVFDSGNMKLFNKLITKYETTSTI